VLARVRSEMKRKISEMKQHVNSKETSMAICLSPSDLPTCDPDICLLFRALISLFSLHLLCLSS